MASLGKRQYVKEKAVAMAVATWSQKEFLNELSNEQIVKIEIYVSHIYIYSLFCQKSFSESCFDHHRTMKAFVKFKL